MREPSGNVTFLFTDIEGSTRLSQHFTEQYQDTLARHNQILHDAVESNNGFVFKTVGDAFCCSFHNSSDAVIAACDIQTLLLNENWGEVVIKVRMGIHSGTAEWMGEDYMGYITLARTSRIMSAAHGEQVIISNDALESSRFSKQFGDSVNMNGESEILFRDLGERRLKDVIQPIKIFQINSPGLREDFPPLRTLDSRPNSLPVQVTNFIGREEEIKEIKNQLAESRIVTLLGTGGSGKTRLSIQIAADVIDEFTNGVWFIELAPLSDPRYLSQTIANVFKLQSQPNQDIEETLNNYLSEKEILLVFDNCEHIVNACSVIAEKLLRNSSRLKILASSREVLHCTGEVTHRVLPLKHPDPKEKITGLQFAQYEAIRLFMERAISVKNDFKIDDNNMSALAQICHRLDGIPLAIELAAARIKILSVEKINERLEDRFRLLTGGKRTDSPRQQTLRALIDWSYDLLSEDEKILFNRLSVFSDGWTLEAAEKICTDENMDSHKISGLLMSLDEKSLINIAENAGVRRYSLLESLKEYGSEKLSDKYNLFKKHLEYYYEIASEEEMKKKGFDDIEWVKAAKSEIENIRLAIKWSIENDTDRAAKIVSETGDLYIIIGYVMEGNHNCTKLLEKNEFPDELSKALIQSMNGSLLAYLGEHIESDKYTRESLAVFRKLNLKSKITSSLNNLGHNAAYISGLQKQKEYYEEALSISVENGFQKHICETLLNLANNLTRSGEKALSRDYLKRTLMISREMKLTSLTIAALAEMAIAELTTNNLNEAMKYTDEGLELAKELNNQNYISVNLAILSRLNFRKNDYAKTEYYLNEALTLCKEYGLTNIYILYKDLGNLFLAMNNFEKSMINFLKSLEYGIKFGDRFFTKINFLGLGISFFNTGKKELSLLSLRVLFCLKTLFPDSEASKITEANKKIKEDAEGYLFKLRELFGDEIYDEYYEESKNVKPEEIEKFVLKNCLEQINLESTNQPMIV